MADLRLLVTPEEVNTKAGEIDNQKSFMDTYLQDMQSKVNQLQEVWDSPSGQEYYTKYSTLAKQIQVALDELTQHVQNLRDAASAYEEAENQQKSLVEGLSTEGVF